MNSLSSFLKQETPTINLDVEIAESHQKISPNPEEGGSSSSVFSDLDIEITESKKVNSFLKQETPTTSNTNDNSIGNDTLDENDISEILSLSLTDHQKLKLLNTDWSPKEDFFFPTDKENRKFQLSWLIKFKWLVYPELKDGAFRLYCILFGNHTSVERTQKLVF